MRKYFYYDQKGKLEIELSNKSEKYMKKSGFFITKKEAKKDKISELLKTIKALKAGYKLSIYHTKQYINSINYLKNLVKKLSKQK